MTQAPPYVKPPRGQPPKDPARLAVYLEQRAAAHRYLIWAAQQEPGKGGILAAPPKVVSPSPPLIAETRNAVISRVADRFEIMYKLTKGCAIGAIRSLIISGAGGIGKTYGVTGVLEAERMTRQAQIELMPDSGIEPLLVEVKGGYMTPLQLYKTLYRNRFANSVLVFDDCDVVLENITSIGLLKHALDTTDKRMITYASSAPELVDESIPFEHEFQGTVIFISNVNFNGIIEHGRSKIVPHLQALVTRTGGVLDLKLHTIRDKVIWIRHVIESSNMLVEKGLSREQQDLAIAYMEDNQDRILHLSFRTMTHIAGYMKTDWSDWQRLANVLMLK